MSTPRRYTTEAVVIRRLDYGDYDRILTLFTPYRGKIRAVAKGIRRPASRRAGHLDLFSRVKLLLAQGQNLDIVTQAESLEQFPGLRRDLMGSSYAHYVSEILDAFLPDNLPNTRVYGAHVDALRALSRDGAGLHARVFEMILLDASGYRPELRHCLGCGKTIIPERNGFSAARGGALCAGCLEDDPAATTISVPALKILRNLQTDPDRVARLEALEPELGLEVESCLRSCIVYRLEKKPKSVAVLDALRRSAAAGS